MAETPATSDMQPISQDRHAELHRLLTLAEPGTTVFDGDNQNIGVVKVYDTTTGYLTIGKGGVFARTYVVPARLITHVETDGVYLSPPEDTLAHADSQAPAIRITVERAPIPGEDGATALYELHWLPDGYDGSPAVVERLALRDFDERLALGMAVHTPSGQRHGVVDENDAERRVMVVERGNIFAPKREDIPYDDIAQIDLDAQIVRLASLRGVQTLQDLTHSTQPPAELTTEQRGAQQSLQSETTDNPHS
ncbi:MAG TPA: PRC-barrel domain-containing protein [Ktedonobacterales bacterium]|nr:PRC-barrel domain-containing protein [Ktedonobacterales bacterium]